MSENETKETVDVPEKFAKLVSEIESLSVLDLAELVKVLEKKFGVSAAAPAVVAVPQAAGEGGSAAGGEEKTSFDVVLKESGGQKIQVIKVVKELTGKGLKESKDIVDAPPQKIASGVTKEQAEEMKKKLEEAGATVELQ
jgi:large subunit ribosomal protein L7/L12